MEKLQYTVNENIDTKLEEHDDQREPQVVFHILLFDAIQGR